MIADNISLRLFGTYGAMCQYQFIRDVYKRQVRKEGQKYPAELIPVRLSEIYLINEGYEWVVSTVKQELKKDFQGIEEDLEKLQQVIDSGKIGSKKKEEWLAIGITAVSYTHLYVIYRVNVRYPPGEHQ